MTKKEQAEHFKELMVKIRDIQISKSGDYAKVDEDVLSNFKVAGNVAGLNAQLNCLSLISTKVARLGVLLNSGKEPNNESIRDSVEDLINYSILLDMILSEN
jgi:hypothetical protein|tara:strand:- start:902 stop:1207 length:306 start_codon:yes stop_codon:yes gene_type:complete